MASFEWSDLPVFLAIAREGTLGAAGRRLGQSQPTMGRRLKALEGAMGVALFQRTADGFVLTDEGQTLLAHAERMETESLALMRTLSGSDAALDGDLRVSCSDWFGRVLLAPVLAELAQRHPGVVVETLTDPRIYNLARREADLVVRMVPFDETEVIARRLVTISYGLYGHPDACLGPIGDGEDCSLVVMDTAFGGMPDVAWITRRLPRARIASRSNSREVQAQLCALGVGLAVLPRPLGDTAQGLQRIELEEDPPSRTQWLGYHRDLRRLPRLRVLADLLIARIPTLAY
ncbi:LysR family transcriptional regulator [Caulobacter sp.]|uniref:LysR family transcriptional regulator n=1 Tax=Caulobacter sp. TaxID=78 RepID=UPI002B4998CB|nr:LysR family transcriptional regulator [Caulobacter sp.]HJV40885.1 LysR family transcriptional regulator [Caulobacter sp.]